MTTNSGFPTLTVNWIAERQKKPVNNSYFREMIFSCIDGMRRGEIVYCFTQEQVDAVVFKANFLVIVVEDDGGYVLKKATA